MRGRNPEKLPNVPREESDPYGDSAYNSLLASLSPRGKGLHEVWKQEVIAAKKNLNRPKYIDEVEAPEAVYRVIYNDHFGKVEIKDVYDSDLTCLEWANDTYKTSDVGKGWIIRGDGPLRQKMPITQTAIYENVDTDAVFGRKPVYLTDIHTPLITAGADTLLTSIPAIEGVRQAYKAATDRNAGINRRTFLTGGASAALLSGPLAIALFPLRTQNDVVRALSEGVEKLNPTMMPALLRLRNLAIAYKAKLAVEDHLSIRRRPSSKDIAVKKPIAAIIVGPLHSRMRDLLSFSTKDLLESLEQLLTFLPHMPDTTRDELENIVRMRLNYRDAVWEANVIRPH